MAKTYVQTLLLFRMHKMPFIYDITCILCGISYFIGCKSVFLSSLHCNLQEHVFSFSHFVLSFSISKSLAHKVLRL